MAPVIHCSSFCLGAAPTWRDAISPFLNSIRVGIDMTPYLEAVCGFSSTLSLTILTLPSSEPEISSSAGPIIRQGPHHSAQKSTTTAPVAFNTSDSKSASETLPTAMGMILVMRATGESLGSRCARQEVETMNAPRKRQGASRGGEGGQRPVQGWRGN